MAANKTMNRTQREERLTEVARLHRQGWNQTEIAKELGVSQPQIAYDLGTIRTRYRATQLEDRAALVAEKLAQYRDVRREAWEAWERSKNDGSKIVDEFGNAQDADGSGETTERRSRRIVTRKGPLPGNEYFVTILRTLEGERVLLGLDDAVMRNFVAVADAERIIRAILESQRECLGDYPHLLQAVQQRTLELLPAAWGAAGYGPSRLHHSKVNKQGTLSRITGKEDSPQKL